MRKRLILLASFVIMAGITAATITQLPRATKRPAAAVPAATPTPPPDHTVTYAVVAGDTYGALAAAAGVPPAEAHAVLQASAAIHSLAHLQTGRPLQFIFSSDGQLRAVSYEPNREDILTVRRAGDDWQADQQPIPYVVRLATADGDITSSLWETMLAQGDDGQLAIALAEVFAWQVDFAVDVRAGDTFAVLYEQRYRDGRYVMPGAILAARFSNDGTAYRAYHFTENDTTGYYNEEGNSLQRVFLKSPLTYRYVSSGYTGKRWDPISKKVTAHYAIDYAARAGTPTVSVGDGTVVQAGWNGGYGRSVTIRHNATYQTRYGHFSRIAKGIRPGTAVTQNQVIGYVGSTGHSTGPHLHYEMYRHGAKVNPYTVELPAGDPIPDLYRAAFAADVQRLDKLMNFHQ